MTNKPLTNKEVLEKAIQKAIDGGWKGFRTTDEGGEWYSGPSPQAMLTYKYFDDVCQLVSLNHSVRVHLNEVIFNHDFAKALWGDKPFTTRRDQIMGVTPKIPWIKHLQQMVIAPDPIKYLGENL